MTSVQCPYSGSLVCSVWCLLQNYKGNYCAGSTTTSTTTTTTTTSPITTPLYNQRPVHLDYPDCPAEYKVSSSAAVLCVMWIQLSQLETAVGTAPQNAFGFIPVTCQFSQFESTSNILKLFNSKRVFQYIS